ncbi:MAG TPA: alpha/beta hydrolase-fold protein [Thermoanaerobaculia bacterium]|nr:alpha/beta hydrolase-fold protein [Thermoanaerobaculia bacterium]
MRELAEATLDELIVDEETSPGTDLLGALAPLAPKALPTAPGADDWPELTPGKIQVLGPFATPGLVARRVRLYLPADFKPDVPRFTLFLFDGQNVFDDGPSYAGGWYAHEAAERLARAGKLAPILVGVDHGGPERIRELSPFPVQGAKGQLDLLLDWLLGTLQPALAERLPLIEGPAGSAVAGSSMGGLAAIYAHFRRPQELGGALAMSPSFWVGDGAILDWVDDQPRPPFSRVYLDCGMREGRGMLLPLVARLAGHLASRGYGDLNLRFRTDPKGLHSEQCWRRRLPAALRFLYR